MKQPSDHGLGRAALLRREVMVAVAGGPRNGASRPLVPRLKREALAGDVCCLLVDWHLAAPTLRRMPGRMRCLAWMAECGCIFHVRRSSN
ncbi:unnamed protein product [Urochloa humidicola]